MNKNYLKGLLLSVSILPATVVKDALPDVKMPIKTVVDAPQAPINDFYDNTLEYTGHGNETAINANKRETKRDKIPEQIRVRFGGKFKADRFAFGNCTAYVAKKRMGVGWLGNGGEWLVNAKAAGYKTGTQPRPGAILVTSESWYGHVAYVERVNKDGSFLISEANFKGFNVVSQRTIYLGDKIIKGFIY